MKKAATGLSCGGFTPSIATNKRGAAVQSTESKDTPRMTETGRLIGPKEAIAIDTAPFSGLDQHYYQLWLRGSDTIDGLEAALAAERDRADRAEVRIAEAWDEAVRSANLVETDARLSIEHDPNPYSSEATA